MRDHFDLILKLLTLVSVLGFSIGSSNYAATEPPARYDFGWSVNDISSSNNYGQRENRHGDVTSGSYFVQLADGRVQRVTYTVDGSRGFVAKVDYENPNGGGLQPSYKG